MSTFTNKTGLEILEFISNLRINYSRTNLSKMVWHEFGEFSILHAKDLLSQLLEKKYLKEIDIGRGFAMIVVELSDKGKEAIQNKETIILDFQRFYTTTYKTAADIGIVDKDIIVEYYNIKKELIELQKREEELKNTIKRAMTENNTPEIHDELMDLYCKKLERITYPKEKVERLVPENILEKIRTRNEVTIL